MLAARAPRQVHDYPQRAMPGSNPNTSGRKPGLAWRRLRLAQCPCLLNARFAAYSLRCTCTLRFHTGGPNLVAMASLLLPHPAWRCCDSARPRAAVRIPVGSPALTLQSCRAHPSIATGVARGTSPRHPTGARRLALRRPSTASSPSDAAGAQRSLQAPVLWRLPHALPCSAKSLSQIPTPLRCPPIASVGQAHGGSSGARRAPGGPRPPPSKTPCSTLRVFLAL